MTEYMKNPEDIGGLPDFDEVRGELDSLTNELFHASGLWADFELMPDGVDSYIIEAVSGGEVIAEFGASVDAARAWVYGMVDGVAS